MILFGSPRPLSELEELELRRERLTELIDLGLVSPSLRMQVERAIDQIDRQITALRQGESIRLAA